MPKRLTAALLIAGTAIGAGMLALPVASGPGGFWPSLVGYILCWLFSAATGLLLLEACFWLPKDSNIISLSSHLLGKKGKYASWFLYLFLFYCLTIAYVAGGGGFIRAVVSSSVPLALCTLIFVFLFSPVVYLGTRAVDRLNFLLMIGLVTFFIAFIGVSMGNVDLTFLRHKDWKVALFSLPVLFTAFSYQGIVPSMRTYFEGDKIAVRHAILIGSTIPLLIYIVWQFLIVGIIPLEGESGLLSAKAQGLSGVVPLRDHADSLYIYALGQAFAFCALTTSFLGVTLGLFDFLADGLRLKKKGRDKKILYLLVFFPPTLITLLNPHIFIRALGFAGGIGCALLLGLIPVLMVWSGRYRKKLDRSDEQLRGGKPLLILLILFVVFELIIELTSELQLLLGSR